MFPHTTGPSDVALLCGPKSLDSWQPWGRSRDFGSLPVSCTSREVQSRRNCERCPTELRSGSLEHLGTDRNTQEAEDELIARRERHASHQRVALTSVHVAAPDPPEQGGNVSPTLRAICSWCGRLHCQIPDCGHLLPVVPVITFAPLRARSSTGDRYPASAQNDADDPRLSKSDP
jgi:hypothetical protein